MKVIIIEDEKLASQHLSSLLNKINPDILILEKISTVQQSVDYLLREKNIDLILMDIKLSDGTAFDIVQQIKIQIPIIFTTAYNNYLLEAFEVQSISYLLKPVTLTKLKEALSKYEAMNNHYLTKWNDQIPAISKLLNSKKKYKERYLVKLGNNLLPISVEKISYFYRDEIVYLVTNEGKKYPVDISLETLKSQLNPEIFIRLNRQFLSKKSSVIGLKPDQNGKLIVSLTPPSPVIAIVSQLKSSWVRELLDQ